MAEESRYSTTSATAYPRSARRSSRASVPLVETTPLGGARSSRSATGGFARRIPRGAREESRSPPQDRAPRRVFHVPSPQGARRGPPVGGTSTGSGGALERRRG